MKINDTHQNHYINILSENKKHEKSVGAMRKDADSKMPFCMEISDEGRKLLSEDLKTSGSDFEDAERQSAAAELESKIKEKVLKLTLKLARGEKLTPKEEKFLIEKDPKAYHAAVKSRLLHPIGKNHRKATPWDRIKEKREEKDLDELEKRENSAKEDSCLTYSNQEKKK